MVALCPQNCNGHGSCHQDKDAAVKTGTCVCHHGFIGEVCEEGDPYGPFTAKIPPQANLNGAWFGAES